MNISAFFYKFFLVIYMLAIVTAVSGGYHGNAIAQDTKELCSGANLDFSGSSKDCKISNDGNKCTQDGKEVSCPERTLNKLVAQIINIFSLVVGIVAVIMLIYSGFRYVTSGGDTSKIEEAKKTLIYAIVGLIIVALAQVIVKFILVKLSS